MTDASNLFDYTYIDNKTDHTLFLFHGTGGTRDDFLFLDTLLEKKYNLVGIQGNVRENGLPRFFKRLAVGVFDQENIQEEVHKLKRFISNFKKTHSQATTHTRFLGYSNGANILLAALFSYPKTFNNLVLLHPMLPFENEPRLLDLSANTFFVSHGRHDPMVTPSQQAAVVEILESCHAILTVRTYDAGHDITKTELEDVVAFLLQ